MSHEHTDNNDDETGAMIGDEPQSDPGLQGEMAAPEVPVNIPETQVEPGTDEVSVDRDDLESKIAEDEGASATSGLVTRPAADEITSIISESPGHLNNDELAALDILAVGSNVQSRRARIILDWDSGLEAPEIAQKAGLSTRTVTRYIKDFEAGRMATFGKPQAKPTRRVRQGVPDASLTAETADRITVEELCRKYDVDMKHSTHVAELAQQLLALTMPLHQLDEHYLDVIYVAGLLHDIAYADSPKKHHTRGRDILLSTPLSGVTDTDRALIAVGIAFHRRPWGPDRLSKEVSYSLLPTTAQPAALWLASVLRIADGLDYSQTQATSLTESIISKEMCLIGVKNPHDNIDRARANLKGDMWRSVAGISLKLGSRKDVRQAMRRRVIQRPERRPVLSTDSMSETGRKLIYFHLQRMLYHEPGVHSSANVEAIHDMGPDFGNDG